MLPRHFSFEAAVAMYPRLQSMLKRGNSVASTVYVQYDRRVRKQFRAPEIIVSTSKSIIVNVVD